MGRHRLRNTTRRQLSAWWEQRPPVVRIALDITKGLLIAAFIAWCFYVEFIYQSPVDQVGP
jgi:hypothetical protein